MSGLYIQKFVDRLQHFERKNAKEFTCSINDARELHADITKLLVDMEVLRNHALAQVTNQQTTVEMRGEDF